MNPVAKLNRKHHEGTTEGLDELRYSVGGHPTLEELMAEQGTGPVSDTAALRGDFWPAEDPIEDFLAALHEWRGHKPADPAA